jgi:hypothetical protein
MECKLLHCQKLQQMIDSMKTNSKIKSQYDETMMSTQYCLPPSNNTKLITLVLVATRMSTPKHHFRTLSAQRSLPMTSTAAFGCLSKVQQRHTNREQLQPNSSL